MAETLAEPFIVEKNQDGVAAGPVRRPGNFSREAAGSIHDDATAQKLGFRGGTIAANTHFDQFPPLALAVFGEDWLKTGGLSLYFLNATTEGEPVQCFIGRPEPRPEGGLKAEAWMATPEGLRICEGSITVGPPDLDSPLRRRIAAAPPATDLRMLSANRVGDRVADLPARMDWERAQGRLAPITEPLEVYTDPARWGGRVLQPALVIDAMRVVEPALFHPQGAFVGMFGAIEVQHLDGPALVDRDYRVDGAVLALTESPKTEAAWYESTLKDAADGRPVASMILLTRLLKGSSPLWA